MNETPYPKRLRALFAFLLSFSMLYTAINPLQVSVVQAERPDSSKLRIEPASASLSREIAADAKDGSPAIYLVRLKDAPLASYRGGAAGLAATSPAATGSQLSLTSPAAVAYTTYLSTRRAEALSAVESTVSRDVSVLYEYFAANNGFAVELTAEEAAAVAKLPEVSFIQREFVRELHTDAGPAWIGAPALWDGTGSEGIATQGEGVVVGVIDTGIDHDNLSFAEVGPIDGYVHVNPLGDDTYLGYCETDPTFCNDKLIGAYTYPSITPTPEDWDGHGSHTASTAAGNVVTATLNAPTTSYTKRISGVAPHANIIAYNACCTGAALTAAIDQIVVDYATLLAAEPDTKMAVNYSIGSAAASDLYNDFDTVGFLAARDAGIFVATSAGNDGPGDETLGSPGDAPWLTTVGNSTHNRAVLNAVVDMSGGTNPPDDIVGKSLSAGYGPAPIVYAGDYGFPLCGTGASNTETPGASAPWPAGTFDGEIVVCDRGTYGRVEKGWNVEIAGAGGMILANDAASGAALVGDPHALPAVHITYADGIVVKEWLETGTSGEHTGSISGFMESIDPVHADIMSASSSRGANRAAPGIVSPSVTAPGTDIFAAYADVSGNDWNIISGTSMASPHVAGGAALLMAIHPDWTPAEVQSAIMLTAHNDVLDDDGVTPATPFDKGNGRIDLNVAALSGLVMDETNADYLAAEGTDMTHLNLASLGNGSCLGSCSWTRTFRNTSDAAVDWTVATTAPVSLTLSANPTNFTIAANGTQTVEFTADVSAMDADVWTFGEVWLTTDAPDSPDLHMPVAVRGTAGITPDAVEILTRRDAGSQLVEGLETIEVTDFTVEAFGLVSSTLTTEALEEDPTNGDPYDAGGTMVVEVTVPAGAKRLVAEIIDTTSNDIDVFVGLDADGDGPEESELVCMSASATAFEYCDVTDPAAGDYWVLVQNWEASAEGAEDVTTVATAVVPGTDSGNMTVEGPATAETGAPYDIRVFWDEPAMEAGQHWYGAFSLGSDAGNPGNIDTIPVDLHRLEDDVTKSGPERADSGDVITYTLTVQPNITPEDLTYMLTDTIPAGTTYVEGSATASAGTVDVTDGVLTWTGVMEIPGSEYVMSTSESDALCTMPLANSGAYVNLQAYGILAQAGAEGDTVWYTWTTSGATPSLNYYGNDVGNVINFTDDGFVFFDPGDQGDEPWENLPIPNTAEPNNMLAIFWRDMEIVYDAVANRGISLANLNSGPGTPTAAHILEYDDVQVYDDPSQTYDFQMYFSRLVDDAAGEYEIIYAYDNISGTLDPLTIGLENAIGTEGIQYTYNDPSVVLEDGMAICFNLLQASVEPVEITFQVTIGDDTTGEVTNSVVHNTDNPGSEEAVASVTTLVSNPTAVTLNNMDAASLPQGKGLASALALAALAAGVVIYRRRRSA